MSNHTNCNADVLANELALSLKGTSLTLPTFDFTAGKYNFDPTNQVGNILYNDPQNITVDNVTDASIDGNGVFDTMMRAMNEHINEQYSKDRITGDEYAEIYSQVLLGVLNNATQFVLSKDSARFQAIQAQMEARKNEIMATAELVNLDRVKLEAAKVYFDKENSEINYALTKMKVANADAEHCLIKAQSRNESFQADKIMPVKLAQEQHTLKCLLPFQTELLEEQIEEQRARTSDYKRDNLTLIKGVVGLEKEVINTDLDTRKYNLNTMLPQQLELLTEQTESERSNTLNTRSDGTDINGIAEQQRESVYQEVLSKIYTNENTLPAQLASIESGTLSTNTDIETKRYNIDNTLPTELAILNIEESSKGYEEDIIRYNLNNIIPAELGILQKRKLTEEQQAELLYRQAEVQNAQVSNVRLNGIASVAGKIKLENDVIGKNLAILDEEILSARYNVVQMLPAQLELIREQMEVQRAQTLDTRTNTANVTGVIGKQKLQIVKDTETKDYILTNTLPIQLDLIKEQREAERAKTLDTRTDAANIAGSVGKQKELYTQQIDSFQKDAKHKAAKMYLDGWITQKTLDEGLIAPTELQNATVDTVLNSIRLANGLT